MHNPWKILGVADQLNRFTLVRWIDVQRWTTNLQTERHVIISAHCDTESPTCFAPQYGFRQRLKFYSLKKSLLLKSHG